MGRVIPPWSLGFFVWGSTGHTLGVHGPWTQRELTTAPCLGEMLPDVQDKHVLCLASWTLGCREEGGVRCGQWQELGSSPGRWGFPGGSCKALKLLVPVLAKLSHKINRHKHHIYSESMVYIRAHS